MGVSSQTYYVDHIELILIFGLVGFALNKFAYQRNFFKLPDSSSFTKTKLCLIHVIISFAIYLINSILVAPLIIQGLHPASHEITATWIQVAILFGSILLLVGFSTVTLQDSFTKIIKDRSNTNSSTLLLDAFLGMITWFLAFPVVAAVEQCADLFVYSLFNIETYEQVAVLYLKRALSSPMQLAAALLMILIAAPVVEELLFRGLLQTWIKKHLGVKAAILLASLCFALFHISASHGVGNLSLVASLFVFSCFLGFIYERQKSLLSSIILHITFNLVSTLRIIFTIDSLP
jgi:membrane protease YdiL (CAAX protease family)